MDPVRRPIAVLSAWSVLFGGCTFLVSFDDKPVSDTSVDSKPRDAGTQREASVSVGTDASPAGRIDVTLTEMPSGSSANLTTEGTLDWVHWHGDGATLTDRMKVTSRRIGDLTSTGTGARNSEPLSYAMIWSNGEPTQSSPAGGAKNGVDIGTTAGTFSFPITAAGDRYALTLYVAGNNNTSEITATASGQDLRGSTSVNMADRTHYYRVVVTPSVPLTSTLLITFGTSPPCVQGCIALMSATLSPP